MVKRMLAMAVAAAAVVVAGSPGFGAEDAATQTKAVDNPVMNRYAIQVHMPTVEEISQSLDRLLERVKAAYPAVITDAKTHQAVTDFGTVNPNARIAPGGYTIGVLHAATLMATEATGDKRFADFTNEQMALISDHYDYFTKQAEAIGMSKSSMKNFLQPPNLDACGAWGAAVVMAKRAGLPGAGTPEMQKLIDTWADFINHKQFRLADGTLARHRPRPDSVWGDDMYMSIPFLAQLGKLTGEKGYYDDAVKQSLQMSERLFQQDMGIYAHGWFAANAEYQEKVYWGRANGWCILANCMLLDVLPTDHPGRDKVLALVRRHIQALMGLQSQEGLWHQLLNKEDSFLETSCSAMFTYAIAHAVNKGWIDPGYASVAQSGWNGIAARQNKDGGFDGTCPGTSFAFDNLYYYHRTPIDGDHGWGPVMMAGSEMIKLLKNDHLKRSNGYGGFYIWSPKDEPPPQ